MAVLPSHQVAPADRIDRRLWQMPDKPTRRRRMVFMLLVGVSVALGLVAAVRLLQPNDTAGYIVVAVLLTCFTILFGWIASNFWMMVMGCVRLSSIHRAAARNGAEVAPVPAENARTAIAIPVYNEDPARVGGSVQAMMEALSAAGALERFDVYILSDSTDPELWLKEEQLWLHLAEQENFRNRIFYRRRARNIERKSGNLKEFLENWGHTYRYMLALDADSVMSANTILELVRRMEADRSIGLLQTWPRIIGGTTLFSRMHQYAADLYGRILACGMASLVNPHGNYWGHNAIIRVKAFMDCCGLPNLPGREPLGGEILSHDFVEAALLVRRGWKVELADDLDGSYEEGPANIVEHLARDQRWCQGNLQHGWLLPAHGFHPVSRINLLTGILAYLSGPIWILFIAIAILMILSDKTLFSTGLILVRGESGAWRIEPSTIDSLMAMGLLGATVLFVLGPKLIGTIAALIERREKLSSLAANVVAEAVLSVLMAPSVMLRHSIFTVKLLCGRGVAWKPQQRDSNRLRWREATQAFWVQTVVALLFTATAIPSPTMAHLWLSPVLLGFILSIPVAVWTGRKPSGQPWLLQARLDREPPQILRRTDHCRAELATAFRREGEGSIIRELIEDPRLNQLHLFFLATSPTRRQGDSVDEHLLTKARKHPEALGRDELARLISSESAVRRLHLEHFAATAVGPTPRVAEGQHS